jgi:hypothetical protein
LKWYSKQANSWVLSISEILILVVEIKGWHN